MDKNSKEYKKLKNEMDDYLKDKVKKKEQQRINSLGYSRGVYPSEEYRKILKKRETGKTNHDNNLITKIIYVLLCIAVIYFIYKLFNL